MATIGPTALSASEAARVLGVSHQTIKQWIYKKRIRATRTPGGHHRIPASEVRRLSGAAFPGATKSVGMEAISGRNKLRGLVTRVRVSGLLAEVILDVGGQELTAIITSAAAKQLRLKAGLPAHALIKATEVMVIGA